MKISDVGKILCRQFGSSKLDEVSARQRWYLITGWGKFWSNGRSESFRCDQLLYHFFKVPFQLLFHKKVLKIKFLTYLKFFLHQETHRISTKSITSYHCKNHQTFSQTFAITLKQSFRISFWFILAHPLKILSSVHHFKIFPEPKTDFLKGRGMVGGATNVHMLFCFSVFSACQTH